MRYPPRFHPFSETECRYGRHRVTTEKATLDPDRGFPTGKTAVTLLFTFYNGLTVTKI